MALQKFKELIVWQEAKKLAVDMYKIVSAGELAKDYGLKEQMRRSAVSIASNIAEGYERNSDKDFIRFLLMAKGSVAELLTQLEIASEIKYIAEKDYLACEDQCSKIHAMLTKLIISRRSRAKK